MLLFLLSCDPSQKVYIEEALPSDTAMFNDLDADGYFGSDDCDDENPFINKDAPELCDGIDNNCNGQIDEDVGILIYLDEDGDGFGADEEMEACEVVEGYSLVSNDCDDEDSTIYPAAQERCDDLDNDCDGEIDEELGLVWFLDDDGDGFGDPLEVLEDCMAPDNYVDNDEDCNDENPQDNPDQKERCDEADNNCDGLIDNGMDEDLEEGEGSVWFVDFDDDGYGTPDSTALACIEPEGYSDEAQDCDDLDSMIFPGSTEYCDGIDNNCNGETDEDTAEGALTLFEDNDGDGFGAAGMLWSCYPLEGYVDNNADCDDENPLANPGVTEICNGIDDNCADGIDEGSAVDAVTWFFDGDFDGFGNPSTLTLSCTEPQGHILDGTDCDDENPQVNPSITEICNGIDDDCSGNTDEPTSADASLWFFDGDADGFGNPNTPELNCYQPQNFVDDNTDCDDENPLANPGVTEICNGIDDNCAEGIDEPTAEDAKMWYLDNDSDSFGNPNVSELTCDQPQGYVDNDTDCDDALPYAHPGIANLDDPNLCLEDADGDGYGSIAPVGTAAAGTDCNDSDLSIHPNASEICNGIDDNCVDGADEESLVPYSTYYEDLDQDGYGTTSTYVCAQPDGWASRGEDCDDDNVLINPAATEICNGIDDNCVDGADEESLIPYFTWYEDLDQDGYGNISAYTCAQPDGHVQLGGDCDDDNPSISPIATEICNGIDDNCMGGIDEENLVPHFTWYEDLDQDGYGNISAYTCAQPDGYISTGGDCDDGNLSINPGASELCNGIDDNCVDGIDEDWLVPKSTWYEDNDNDGYGTDATESCGQPEGYAENPGDCDDDAFSINPGTSEVCGNAADDNCNGSFSENCSSQYTYCGGPGALQPGVSLSCSIGGVWVHRLRVSSGCNDGESGNYTFYFDDYSSVTVSGGCNTEVEITPRLVNSITMTMTSGGGGDNNISFTCCGSSGWGVYYQ